MITKVKGTFDLLPEDTIRWQELENITRQVCKLYDFQEIRTPIFEQSELFHRGVGDTTDIVKKETYDFLDRGERSITLRPEGTASVVRSVIENKLYTQAKLPLKYYYIGPMFRYERPQKGRQRQFHQFGAEALGSFSPSVDAEIISLAHTYLKAYQIPNVIVKLNSLGDALSKSNYRATLLDYLGDKHQELCKDCNVRYQENPLRVLDCKVDHENPVLQNAPKPLDHLSVEAKTHFEQVCQYLNHMNIPYEIDKSLVRGLDYYTHTVFELISNHPNLGANTTLGGGGRYNDLVRSLGGVDFPAVGFAFGMERLLLAQPNQEVTPEGLHAFVIALDQPSRLQAAQVVRTLRHGGVICDQDLMDRPLKGQFKQAERQQAMFLIIIGEDEINSNSVQLKNTKTGEQEKIALTSLYPTLVERIRHFAHDCQGSCHDCDGSCE